MSVRPILLLLLLLPIAASADAPDDRDSEPQVSFGQSAAAVVDSVDASIWIDAPPQKVWGYAVEDFDGWWPHCYKADSQVQIETQPGGRIWERFNDGQGAIYGHVLYIDEPTVIKMDGSWGMPGTAVSGGVWRFESSEAGTVFRIKGEAMGNFPTGQGFDGREEAYRGILRQLKKFVETGERIDRTGGEG